MLPLRDNPLETPDQLLEALIALHAPLSACTSPGGARCDVEPHGSTADPAAAALEAFARPLTALAAAAMAGRDVAGQDAVLRGLTNGADPGHPEYWGRPRDHDQRLVEASAIAVALLLAPKSFWWPLTPVARANLIAWLVAARDAVHFDNNWLGMQTLTDLALDRLAGQGDAAVRARWRDRMEAFHIGDGWYRDGQTRRADHYNGFAIHFDALLIGVLDRADGARAERSRSRAAAFAAQFAHWFAADGAALPFGRSLSYRFSCAAFWGALAFTGVEALPWGQIRGLWQRHLRWWFDRPITRRDGLLTLGFAYPNAALAEDYMSAGSPWWALRAFLPLALPGNHPFWTSAPIDLPRDSRPVTLPAPGMLISHRPNQTIALVSGQQNMHIRDGAEKYAKFAYSTRHGFCIEPWRHRADWAAVDNMIGFTVDGGELRVRNGCDQAMIGDNLLHSRWRPWPEMTVDSWLWWLGEWHVRLHRIAAPIAMTTIEGGFAIRHPGNDAPVSLAPRFVRIRAGQDVSAIADIGPAHRTARVQRVAPNSSLIHPRAMVPQLVGRIAAGETWLATAIYAGPDDLPPPPPIDLAAECRRIDTVAMLPVAVHGPPG